MAHFRRQHSPVNNTLDATMAPFYGAPRRYAAALRAAGRSVAAEIDNIKHAANVPYAFRDTHYRSAKPGMLQREDFHTADALL